MMDKFLLSMKETASLDLKELMVGSSLDFVLMNMLKMIHFVHSFQSPFTMIWEF